MESELLKDRAKWLAAAKVYYLSPGDDSGMSDHQWDALGRHLFSNRDKLPLCPILNEPSYQGGSLFWVTYGLFDQAEKAYALDETSR